MSSRKAFESTNLENLLQSLTPIIPFRKSSQSSLYDIKNNGKPTSDRFLLSELWDSYEQWSAFGASTPIRLKNGEKVVQYYTPLLSGIQIYLNKPVPGRNLEQNTSLPKKNPNGDLYFEYIDYSSPYNRPTLHMKVTEFIDSHKGLSEFKNTDLSPQSWMGVAWYPIYQIPNKIDLKGMDACFLTFHKLSSYHEGISAKVGKDFPSTQNHPDRQVVMVPEYHSIHKEMEADKYYCLPPFGLATYRMQGDIWMKPNSHESAKVDDLYKAAESWLKRLNLQHHDFNFFSSHRN